MRDQLGFNNTIEINLKMLLILSKRLGKMMYIIRLLEK